MHRSRTAGDEAPGRTLGGASRNGGHVDSDTIQTVGIIFSIALGAISLLVGAYQARLMTQQMRSTSSETNLGHLMQLNQWSLENAEIDLTKLAGDQYGARDVEERKAQILTDMWLMLLEEVFYQHRTFGIYSAEHWDTWERVLLNLGRSEFVRAHWTVMREEFDDEFVRVVDKVFVEAATRASPNQGSSKGSRRGR